MPLHKYICFHCTYKFELQLLLGDDTEEVPCPRCGCASIPRPPVFDKNSIPLSLQEKRKSFAKKKRDVVHRKAKEPTLDFNVWLESIGKEKRKDNTNRKEKGE